MAACHISSPPHLVENMQLLYKRNSHILIASFELQAYAILQVSSIIANLYQNLLFLTQTLYFVVSPKDHT